MHASLSNLKDSISVFGG